MKPGMKMMVMDRMRQQTSNNRSEYGGGNRRMIGYDRNESGNANTSNYGGMEGDGGSRNYAENRMENRRRRDSRGRYMEGEGYQGNRGYGRSETESRRLRDSRGRYMMGGMDDDDEEEMYSQQTWFPPYGRMPPNMHSGYGDIYAEGTIYAPNAMNRPGMMGMEQEWAKPVDEHTARKWVQKMDGGEKFKPEQLDQLRQAVCPECEKWEFYVTINAMYSDYCETAKKMGIDKPEFYAYLAKDFLKDKDAKPHKLRRYMEHIAK